MTAIVAAAAALTQQASSNAGYPRSPSGAPGEAARDYDILVYGSTPAGIAAAVAAKRVGRSVILLTPDHFVGGMMSAGLGYSDMGISGSIGGLSRRFFGDVARHYARPQAWRRQSRDQFVAGLRPRFPLDFADRRIWVRFEPHVAEGIFSNWLRTARIPVLFSPGPPVVTKRGAQILSVGFGRHRISARVVIDASYEGDLMAAAGARYRVGRESAKAFGERYAGIRRADAKMHNFTRPVDAFVKPRDPASGLLAGVERDDDRPDGSGDDRLQAFTYRLCMTDVAANRLPIATPPGYDPAAYELLGRYYAAGYAGLPLKLDPIPNRKYDVNNLDAVSTDDIGANRGFATMPPEQRKAVALRHRRWIEGLMTFLRTDRRVPAAVRRRVASLGLCRDEFVRNGGWPYQLYVREARRLAGLYTVTEHDLFGQAVAPDAAALASYQLDSHNVRRYVDGQGHARNEGDVEIRLAEPFPVSMRAMLPPEKEVSNLIVPVALSATHTAYGSIRMEPVFMALGESAGLLASAAIAQGTTVQAVSYATMRPRLKQAGQVIRWPWYRHAFFRRKVDRIMAMFGTGA